MSTGTVLVILAHPQKGSFNHAIAQTAVQRLEQNGQDVIFHDLYEESFDPIMPGTEVPSDPGFLSPEVQMHCEQIASADGIVIVHPNWWGQPPAILKGWVDRIFRPDVAYRFLEGDNGEGVPEGLLKAKCAVVFNTANTPAQREQDAFGDPLQLMWKNCIFDLCGVSRFHREMFTVIVTSTLEQRKAWLAKVEAVIDECFLGK
jgi:NAD(P)H dehydrogenase (quinone)